MRTFIAIELDESMRTELTRLQCMLKQSATDVKWVTPENIHLTLKFLGDTPDDRIQNIKDSLKEIASRTDAFNISLSELGAFPNLNLPRVVWVGIEEGAEELNKIAVAFGNDKFSAHITLGRIRLIKRRGEPVCSPQIKGQTHRSAPTMIVNHITLFQSTITPKGPIYTNLYEAMLKPI